MKLQIINEEGGLSTGKTIYDIAKMHNVPVEHIMKQLDAGVEVEKEHGSDMNMRIRTAKDHLVENPSYYDPYLREMEEKMEREEDKPKPISESELEAPKFKKIIRKKGLPGIFSKDQDDNQKSCFTGPSVSIDPPLASH